MGEKRYPRIPVRRRVKGEHIVFAYEHILLRWVREGLSAEDMRTRLREETELHVGRDAILTVVGGMKIGTGET